MRRKTWLMIILSLSMLLLFLSVVYFVKSEDKEQLENILSINIDNITKIEISNLNGDYRSSVKSDEIAALIDYFNQVSYKHLLNDQTAYMPKRTRIIYLYENEDVDFIITYGKEAMINRKVYQVKNGQIDQKFLMDYYAALAEK